MGSLRDLKKKNCLVIHYKGCGWTGYFLDWSTVPKEHTGVAKDGSRAYEGVGIRGIYKQISDIPAYYENELIFFWNRERKYWQHRDKTVSMILNEMV
jgi:hypothetical protein